MERRLLDQIEDTLQVASEIKTPSLMDEKANAPTEPQGLLSTRSERKITNGRSIPFFHLSFSLRPSFPLLAGDGLYWIGQHFIQ